MSHIRDRLGSEGALVPASVAVHTVRERLLRKHELPVPKPILVKAQLDTGAHRSGIHVGIFSALALDGEIDVEAVRTSSTGEEPHQLPVYLCNLTFHGADGDRTFASLRVLAHVFGDNEEARAIIGRDVLNQCHLDWDGPGQWFTLTF